MLGDLMDNGNLTFGNDGNIDTIGSAERFSEVSV